MLKFKRIAILLSWLALSPLFLILDGRWKLLPKWLRIVLFLVSPMMVIVYFLAIAFADFGMERYTHKCRFTNPRAVEKLTGVAFPDYKVIEYTPKLGHGPKYFVSLMEFDSVPNNFFYNELEKQDNCQKVGKDTLFFSRQYHYLLIENLFFSEKIVVIGDVLLELVKGSKSFEVSLFEWPDHNRYLTE